MRSGLVASEKTSPMRARSESGARCSARRTSRSGGSAVCGAAREALARARRSVLVVGEQDAAGAGEIGRPVLRLAVGAHDALVAADAEVVLGRDAAGVVERLLAGQHHGALGRHDEDAARVHEHRRLGVPVGLGADVDAGDDDVDLAAGLREEHDAPQDRGDPVHVLGAAVHGDLGPGGEREPLQRNAELPRPCRCAAMIRRHSGSASEPSARVGSPSRITRSIPSGWRSVTLRIVPTMMPASLVAGGRSTGHERGRRRRGRARRRCPPDGRRWRARARAAGRSRPGAGRRGGARRRSGARPRRAAAAARSTGRRPRRRRPRRRG